MKRGKNLYHKIHAFDNILLAARLAARGKRERPDVLRFFLDLEENILELQAELTGQIYVPGAYTTFQIYDPKPRLISRAPFRDRVMHHALMNIVAPVLERGFIHDTYANRKGKGTHSAIRRYQSFARKFSFALKCDIRKYFPSIDHAILKSLIRKKISCSATLWLIETIIDGSNPQEEVIDYFPGDTLFTPFERRKGLPIGNLTSQLFANFYLNAFDHFVKEHLRCVAYLRYVDDFVLFSNSKRELHAWLRKTEERLVLYRLKLHPKRTAIYPSCCGRLFLGQRVFSDHRRLPSANVRKFKKRMKGWKNNPPKNIAQRIASWRGHAQQANMHCFLKVVEKTESHEENKSGKELRHSFESSAAAKVKL